MMNFGMGKQSKQGKGIFLVLNEFIAFFIYLIIFSVHARYVLQMRPTQYGVIVSAY